jgi:hypothetical protein
MLEQFESGALEPRKLAVVLESYAYSSSAFEGL